MRAPDGADLLDQVVVARPVEHDRRDVVDHAAERVGDRADVVADRPVERDRAARARADRHLAHVHVGQRRHRAARRRGDHRDRVRAAARDDGAALERVEREVVLLAARADRSMPAASCSASSAPPITTWPLIGIRSSASRAPENAASSAASLSARPSQRAPASAARSVTRANVSHWHGRASGPRPGLRARVTRLAARRSAACITSSITWSIVRSTFAFSTTGTLSRRARPDDVGLDAPDVVDALEVLVHRANAAGRGVANVEVHAVHVLVGDLEHDMHEQRALELGRQQARHEVHALEHHRPAFGRASGGSPRRRRRRRDGTGRRSRRSSGRRSPRRRAPAPASKLE